MVSFTRFRGSISKYAAFKKMKNTKTLNLKNYFDWQNHVNKQTIKSNILKLETLNHPSFIYFDLIFYKLLEL